ncbi:MAG: hypothetical protein HAW59_01090 [Betaproteobacteria bacterium]|nr:hypothetical protein [Betaproteobacteria bacterium]
MQCETEGCENRVSKPGFKLCLGCWKKQRGGFSKKNNSPKNPEHGGAVRRDSSGGKGGLTATKIAEHFGIKTPARINAILNELGLMRRAQKGWIADAAAIAMGAEQKTYPQTGVPFVVWPPDILQNGILRGAVSGYLGENAKESDSGKAHDADEFRKKFPAEFRATDGHMVRSKAETLIDNFLYTAGIVHAYERKLPIEEDAYCDFYLPGGKVYIEFWGLENDAKYAARKKQKLEIYAKYKFNLIELADKEVENLDDHLPRLLLKFNIAVD